MERIPEDPEVGGDMLDESAAAGPASGGLSPSQEAEIASLSVAEQIRRQVRQEAGAPPADPNFDFQMSMRAGSNELTDEAQRVKAETGQEFEPPPFKETEWQLPIIPDPDESSGPLLRWVVVGGLVVLLLLATFMYGLPAYRDYSAKQAQSATSAKLAEQAPLEPVTLDDAFYADLDLALESANSALHKAGAQAHIYRYRVKEETVANQTQTLTLTAVAGGPGAGNLVGGAHRAEFDAALKPSLDKLTSHSGVTAQVALEDGTTDSTPLDGDRYLRYGYDYGREHMTQLQPVIDHLEQRRRADGHYPRVLEVDEAQSLRTSGGFAFMARGFAYLPIYASDSKGNIAMGTGDSTLEQLTPKAVTGYYLFYYLDKATAGLDLYGPEAMDYYTRKIAPLPYDPEESLHNVRLVPDGKPDGVGCVVQNGKLLHDSEI